MFFFDVKVSAEEYLRLLFDWVERQVSDTTLFVNQDESVRPYPRNFEKRVKV